MKEWKKKEAEHFEAGQGRQNKTGRQGEMETGQGRTIVWLQQHCVHAFS